MPTAPPVFRHRPKADSERDRKRQFNKRGRNPEGEALRHTAAWRRARVTFLVEHPICVECHRIGRASLATVVDHIVPHRGNHALFWDQHNWAAMCAKHHNAKTAREVNARKWGDATP